MRLFIYFFFFLLFIIHFPCPILGESAIVYGSVGLSALCFTMETEEERNWILLQRALTLEVITLGQGHFNL